MSGAQLLAMRLTEFELDAFLSEIKEEMFAMFNKGNGTKYRSLVTNIKDCNNRSLFQKIC